MTIIRTFSLALFIMTCAPIFAAAQPNTPVTFRQLAELTSSDGAMDDEFGYSLAISGNTLVVSAPQLDVGGAGKAYVFMKGASGWASATQIAELTPSDGVTNLGFGFRVAISGNTIVVDAGSFDGSGVQSREYVFVEPAGGWTNMTETAQLILSSGEGLYAVAVAGNTIMAAATEENNEAGAIYVFVKPQSGWRNNLKPKARLTASDGVAYGVLGTSVAFDGNTCAAGSPNRGVYVFAKPASGWVTATQTAKLTSSNESGTDDFGVSASIAGKTIAVGAATYGGTQQYYGAAYLFYEPSTGWVNATQNAQISAPNLQSQGYFGVSVGISGSLLAVGATGEIVAGTQLVGAVYLFDGTGQLAELTPSEAQFDEEMGWSVIASGDTIVAGAVYATVGSNIVQGKAYVFGP
jgi:hypothetical protein